MVDYSLTYLRVVPIGQQQSTRQFEHCLWIGFVELFQGA